MTTWIRKRALRRFAAPFLAALLALAPATAPAQNLFEPVAKVNESVVTAYELSQRIAFLTLLRAPGDVRELALEQLIGERLQKDAAQNMGIEISAEMVTQGMEEFASRANMSAEEFVAALAQGGVAAETFRDFVAAGVTWREVVRARFSSQVNITDSEVDRALATIQPEPGLRVLMAQITLPASTPESKRASLERANEFRQFETETEFSDAARRYSSGATRTNGGLLNWLNVDDLPPEVARAVVGLEPGQISAPVEIASGIAIFQMREKEQITRPSTELQIDYLVYYMPGGRSDANLAEAARIDAETDTCMDVFGYAKGASEEVLSRQTQPVSQIPADIALELAQLDEGEISTAVTRGENLALVMLCGRTYTDVEKLPRAAVLSALQNQRLSDLAVGYLQELRENAFIEIYVN